MKENRLIQMERSIKNLEGQMIAVIGQLHNLKDLSVGTLETLKRTDGYQKAVDQLKDDIQTDSGKKSEELLKE